MRKFKFAALALAGVGALGCSGHKLSMKEIDLAAAEKTVERINNHISSEQPVEFPDNFKMSFSYSLAEKVFYKDTQAITAIDSTSGSFDLYFDLSNMRMKVVMTIIDETETEGTKEYTKVTQEGYWFPKDGKTHMVVDYGYGYYVEDEKPEDLNEEEWKSTLKEGAYKFNEQILLGGETIQGGVLEYLKIFMQFDQQKGDLPEGYYVNNKYGANDDTCLQMIVDDKVNKNPLDSNDTVTMETTVKSFSTIENYLFTNCDLTCVAKTNYNWEESDNGLITGNLEMELKASGKLEKGKGGSTPPENYLPYQK